MLSFPWGAVGLDFGGEGGIVLLLPQAQGWGGGDAFQIILSELNGSSVGQVRL